MRNMSSDKRTRRLGLSGLLLLVIGLLGFIFGIDRTPPTLEAVYMEAGYGEKIAVSEFITASDDRSETVDLEIESVFRHKANISEGRKCIQFDKPGDYIVNVKGVDESDNEAKVKAEIHVIDSKPPVFEKVTSSVEFEYGKDIFLAEDNGKESNINKIPVKAEDEISEVSYSISKVTPSSGANIRGSSVSFSDIGKYVLTVTAADESGNRTSETVEATIIDKVKPELSGIEETIKLSEYDKKVDFLENVTASDEIDGDLTEAISVDSSAVKYGVPGTYVIKYIVSDQSGNKRSAKSKVRIEDTTPPKISLNTTAFNLTAGDAAPDYMASMSASDALDKNIKVSVDDSDVNYSKAGTYEVTYSAFDSSGNSVSKSAKVVIEEPPVQESVYAGTRSMPNFGASAVDSFGTGEVYITNTGDKFHTGSCRYLRESKIPISRSDAVDRGYTACKVCRP